MKVWHVNLMQTMEKTGSYVPIKMGCVMHEKRVKFPPVTTVELDRTWSGNHPDEDRPFPNSSFLFRMLRTIHASGHLR